MAQKQFSLEVDVLALVIGYWWRTCNLWIFYSLWFSQKCGSLVTTHIDTISGCLKDAIWSVSCWKRDWKYWIFEASCDVWRNLISARYWVFPSQEVWFVSHEIQTFPEQRIFKEKECTENGFTGTISFPRCNSYCLGIFPIAAAFPPQ